MEFIETSVVFEAFVWQKETFIYLLKRLFVDFDSFCSQIDTLSLKWVGPYEISTNNLK